MLPWWKVKREWSRLLLQASQWHWFAFGNLRRWIYDLTKDRQISTLSGTAPIFPDMAIVLVFQPSGITKSTYTQLKYLISKKVTPIVVSNAPLTKDDANQLCNFAHIVMQRPNFGYDFGGYRDGILWILNSKLRPNNLFVINDSIWFPLTETCGLIDIARENSSDIFGIYHSERPSQPHRNHIQSYFYRFKSTLLSSSEFSKYWSKITLTNNKYMVIRQCEIKLTGFFKKAGYTVSALFTQKSMEQALLRLSDMELIDVARYIGKTQTRIGARVEGILSSGDNWRENLNRFIESGGFGNYYLIAHPLVLFKEMKSPILKKDRQPIYQLQRNELITHQLHWGFEATVKDEILSWDPVKYHAHQS